MFVIQVSGGQGCSDAEEEGGADAEQPFRACHSVQPPPAPVGVPTAAQGGCDIASAQYGNVVQGSLLATVYAFLSLYYGSISIVQSVI